MSPRLQLREIAEASKFDPVKAVLDAIGDKIEGIEVFGSRVLCATYIGPDRSAGGILFTDRKLLESRFQGKIFLVLKVGPIAFQDDAINKFGGLKAAPLEWVIANPSDGYELFTVDEGAAVACRIFEDTTIKGKVNNPEIVY